MQIFYEMPYTVIIEIVWTFYLKRVPAKFQKYLKHISWVISGTSSSKLSCNPHHPSWNISCNHRHHLLQPSWRRIFSTSNNQKTRVDSNINSDCKASSFDKLYNRCRKWNTAGFVRAHQRKYQNVLTVGRGHADDGCSCNHRAVPPSDYGDYFMYALSQWETRLQYNVVTHWLVAYTKWSRVLCISSNWSVITIWTMHCISNLCRLRRTIYTPMSCYHNIMSERKVWDFADIFKCICMKEMLLVLSKFPLQFLSIDTSSGNICWQAITWTNVNSLSPSDTYRCQ